MRPAAGRPVRGLIEIRLMSLGENAMLYVHTAPTATVLVYQDKGECYDQSLSDYRDARDVNRVPLYDVREYERTVRAGGYSATVYVIVAEEI